jgi:pimeloyl-ACP methyl ester carboxylesterase
MTQRLTYKRRTPLLAAIAVIASGALLAGCSTGTSDPAPADGDQAAALAPFLDQELAFDTCDPAVAGAGTEVAECAMLEVPLDYDDPDGTTIEVGVARVASAADDRIGSVVVNPGGPGQPAATFAPVVAAAWADDPGLARFDVVGLDPRGVGMSEPAIDCYTDEQRDADAITTPIPPPGLAWTDDTVRDVHQQCAEGSGGEEFLAHVGTRDVARDLDVLRAVLGEEKLSFFGASYGTRLGAIYAETFPENVRALVLDGAVDPRKDGAERQLQLYAGLQKSFEQLAVFCAEQGDCPLGDDPTAATAEVQDLLQPLVDEPIVSSTGREVSFYNAVEGIVLGLYDDAVWPAVIAGLMELREGRADTLLALRDLYAGRSEEGTYSSGSDAGFVINCIDERPMTTAETTAVLAETRAAAPFMDPGADVQSEYGCAGWPDDATLDFPYATDIQGLPQTLVVSTTGDGLTPHEGGVALAEALDAGLLTVDGEKHGMVTSGDPCVSGIVSDYLVNLDVPEDGARCEP